MTDTQKAERALSALGRPINHARGLYAAFLEPLSELVDDAGNLIPDARSQWLVIHEQAMEAAPDRGCCG